MPEIEKLVPVGEVQKPSSDAVEANLGATRQEIRTDAWRRLGGGFLFGAILHLCESIRSIVSRSLLRDKRKQSFE